MLTEILIVIVLILVCVLIIISFFTLYKLNRSMDVLSTDLHRLIDSTIPVLDNLNEASEKIAKVAEDAKSHMDELNEFIITTKNKLNFFTARIKEGADQNPVLNLVRNLSALSKGISAFWEKYKS